MGMETTERESRDPHLGTTLAGRFEIQAPLAAGTMGRVYVAIQQPIGRRVALKIMHIRGGADKIDDFSRRFTQEASVLGQLEHPHTVRLYDYGVDGEKFFLAMELVDGPTLRAIMRDGPLAPLRAFELVRQICGALDEAHSKGIIHRDLKPSNVLLTQAGGRDFVKVVDFGLVKVQDVNSELTQPGLVMGTPNYMSPEQVRGDLVDHRVDIYALGIIMFTMLTGQKPFTAETSTAILAAHLAQQPRLPSEANSSIDLPECVEWTLMRCLEKNPADRFRSVAELASALNACELALRYADLRDVKIGLVDGHTVLPSPLAEADDVFNGIKPMHVTVDVPVSRASNTNAVLATIVVLGLIAIAVLMVNKLRTGPAGEASRSESLPTIVVPAPVLPSIELAPLPAPTVPVPIEPDPVPPPSPVAPRPVRAAPSVTPKPRSSRPAVIPKATPAPAPISPPKNDKSDLRDPFTDQR